MDVKATMKSAGIASSSAPRYRRSRMCTAPRKRTFIAQMEKSIVPVQPVAVLSRECTYPTTDNGDGWGGAGRIGGEGGSGGSGKPQQPGGGGGSSGPQSSLYLVGLAAAVMVAVLAPANAAHAAAVQHALPAGSSAYFAVAGFSRAPKVVRNVAGAIPYGVIELSTKEMQMVAGGLRQLNTRETLRV